MNLLLRGTFKNAGKEEPTAIVDDWEEVRMVVLQPVLAFLWARTELAVLGVKLVNGKVDDEGSERDELLAGRCKLESVLTI